MYSFILSFRFVSNSLINPILFDKSIIIGASKISINSSFDIDSLYVNSLLLHSSINSFLDFKLYSSYSFSVSWPADNALPNCSKNIISDFVLLAIITPSSLGICTPSLY